LKLIDSKNPAQALGHLPRLVAHGLMRMNVEMNQKWTFEDIKNMVKMSFSLYQEYKASKGPQDNGLMPWRLCYRNCQMLSVF
jgi:hypothetical protein